MDYVNPQWNIHFPVLILNIDGSKNVIRVLSELVIFFLFVCISHFPAFKNASNAKAERMKELQELRNRHGEKRQPELTIGSKTPSRESAFEIVEENEQSRIQSNLTIVNSSSPEKSSLSMPKLENAKGFRKSPAKDSYAGLDEVKPIRVSPPKPGKLYPCLSDIEMTTENETDSDDSEDIASPSDSR
jgi:hypothetical protein